MLSFYSGNRPSHVAIADGSYAPQQWKNSVCSWCFVLGAVLLGVLVYVEGRVVRDPLLPPDIFRVKFMAPLVISLLSLYGSVGIFLLYGTL